MKKYAKYPALAVTLAIMAVIFVLSSQPAELSTKVSRAVTETVQAGRIKAITPLWFSTTNLNATSASGRTSISTVPSASAWP